MPTRIIEYGFFSTNIEMNSVVKGKCAKQLATWSMYHGKCKYIYHNDTFHAS